MKFDWFYCNRPECCCQQKIPEPHTLLLAKDCLLYFIPISLHRLAMIFFISKYYFKQLVCNFLIYDTHQIIFRIFFPKKFMLPYQIT